ncbi:MAG: hypothetical protein HRU22_06440 [Gammaproteobacteria bacterium]|nr:hypothetical protein [Gammaproteobacteria bacterium]
MKLVNKMVLSTLLVGAIFSAQALEISAQTHTTSLDLKVQTYIGNVHMKLDNNLKTTSQGDVVTVVDGETTMTGNVEISFGKTIATTEKATFVNTEFGYVVKMDAVTLTYK